MSRSGDEWEETTRLDDIELPRRRRQDTTSLPAERRPSRPSSPPPAPGPGQTIDPEEKGTHGLRLHALARFVETTEAPAS